MLAKEFRFHGHHSLDYTYRHGKTVRSQAMNLRFSPSKRENYRVAVVVSRKVSKSAVVRNKIRRRIYETIRKYDKASHLPKNDMIISVFDESLATISQNNLETTLAKMIEKTYK